MTHDRPHANLAPIASTPSEALRLALRRARTAPQLDELLAREVDAKKALKGAGCGAAFGLVFAGFGAFWTFMAFTMTRMAEDQANAPKGMEYWFPLFGVPFILIGLAIAFGTLRKRRLVLESEQERHLWGVLEERTETSTRNSSSSSGHNRTRTTTTHYVTFEDEAGDRFEFEATSSIAGKITQGDVGVAYVQGGTLLEFERIRPD
ncbi:MAG: DUF2500 family protein [Planctomycetes bacterium]|nr:DUF2500 family protein [Planctomycetota bacterium]